MSQQATKISQPIRDSRLLANQESRTFGSEIKQGNAYFRLEDEEIVDYVSSTETRLWSAYKLLDRKIKPFRT